MKYINLNQSIYFKVKPLGEEILKEKGHNLTPNEKGYCELSICNFMYVFGEFMGVTVGLKPNPYISFDVCFNEKDMGNDSDKEEYENLIKGMDKTKSIFSGENV